MSSPDLGSLRGELRAAGVFEHCELRGWIQLGVLLAGVAACLVGVAVGPWWSVAPLIIAAGILGTSAAMLGHQGSHRSFSASPARNALLVHLIFPLFGGLSARYWREKHDRLHHGHPNVDGQDPDIRPFPFVSSREEHLRCGPVRRWFHRRFQASLFWPLTTLMAAGMRRSSILYVASDARRGIDRGWLLDAGCLTAHYTGWLLVPSLVWGPLAAFGLYASMWMVGGVMLAMVFAPAHIGLPIVRDQNHDWIHQLETTRNLELSRFTSWLFVGLDYQVEHHLFPRIPHQHLPRAAAITSAWCRRQGLPYLSLPYSAAFIDATRFMATAWKRETSTAAEVRSRSSQITAGAAAPGGARRAA